ncbi:MAG: AMP-binding protein [Motiliproteus sp.]
MAQLNTSLQRCPIAQQAQQQPNAIALLKRNADAPSNHYSYLQLDLAVTQKQHWLLDNGTQPGQHLAVLSHDKIELVELLFAALRLGLVLIPINPNFPAIQQQRLIERCDADYLIGGSHALTVPNRCLRLAPGVAGESKVVLQTSELNFQQNQSQQNQSQQQDQQNQQFINPAIPLTGLFTSGSTGTPKLVIHSFHNHVASAQASRQLIDLHSDDGWGITLPLYHIGGMAIVFRTVLAGACLIVPTNEPLSALLSEPRLTHLSAVSTQLLQLRQQLELQQRTLSDFTLKTLLLGGSSIPETLLQWVTQPTGHSVTHSQAYSTTHSTIRSTIRSTIQPLHRRSPLSCFISYGLTEMASQVVTGPINANAELAQCLSHCQIQLGDDGEILIQGESLFLGYYRQGRLQPSVDEHGWFHSRDLGQFSCDGGLIVTGRLDNQFISGGENIQPEQIEAKLRQLSAVSDAIVVPVTDPVYGQRPAAFIVMKKSAKDQNKEQPETNNDRAASIQPVQAIALKQSVTDAIDKTLRQQLAGYQLPRLYLQLPEPQLTLKPDRRQLSQIADGCYQQKLSNAAASECGADSEAQEITIKAKQLTPAFCEARE